MNSCCDFHGLECREGRDCPARQAAKVWCETSKQFCAQPYTCASGCQIKAYNTAYDPVYEWSLTPMGWVVLAGLASWLAAIAVYFFYF
jgi:D-arabinose 1-dehydrogenase-like Zn-dependent alcohol dehydrogenase